MKCISIAHEPATAAAAEVFARSEHYDPTATLSDDQIPRLGADRHFRADFVPPAELAIYRRSYI